MIYDQVIKCTFISRPNRFIAWVEYEGVVEQAHVKNTGRCKELLIEGVQVICQKHESNHRKTKLSLIAVYKGDTLINIDSQVPNAVVEEAIKSNQFHWKVQFLKREVTFQRSRFDLYYENEHSKGFIEVKGVTLEKAGIAMFPDAPTQRGTKHLEELIIAQSLGYQCAIVFLVQLKGVVLFQPNRETDPEFAKQLIRAHQCGVKILVYDCYIEEEKIVLDLPIPFDLGVHK